MRAPVLDTLADRKWGEMRFGQRAQPNTFDDSCHLAKEDPSPQGPNSAVAHDKRANIDTRAHHTPPPCQACCKLLGRVARSTEASCRPLLDAQIGNCRENTFIHLDTPEGCRLGMPPDSTKVSLLPRAPLPKKPRARAPLRREPPRKCWPFTTPPDAIS